VSLVTYFVLDHALGKNAAMRYTLLTRRKTSNIQPNHAGDRSMPAILTTILSAHEGTREAIIPILQQVQEELGYLPEDAML
jgi:NADH:ubiquinone oxidoreductase subunit E